jgi:hypothetical protein
MRGRDTMTIPEATAAIRTAARLTAADISAAQVHLLGRCVPNQPLPLHPELQEWQRIAAPAAPSKLAIQREDVDDQILQVSRAITAAMAVGAAAWRLVETGICYPLGQGERHVLGWEYETPREKGGLPLGEDFVVLCPQSICRAAWQDARSELFDSDLYLQHLAPAGLSIEVSGALRASLACFRRDLHLPCVAMLGAAAEAMWIETGRGLASVFTDDKARSLESQLDDRSLSTAAKVERVCLFYEGPLCRNIRGAAGVAPKRLRSVQHWTDQVRESRNVLHWGATPSVPTTYEKVAVLLMDAVSELKDLKTIIDVSAFPEAHTGAQES